MPLIHTNSAAPSARPYALNPDTFQLGGASHTIEAIWLGRKNGRTRVSLGKLRLFAKAADGPRPRTLEDYYDVADSRYGGEPRHIWDGTSLWTDPSVPWDPNYHRKIVDKLDDVLNWLPEVPSGYVGWMRLVQ